MISDFPKVDLDLDLTKINVLIVEKVELLEKFDDQREEIRNLRETFLGNGNKKYVVFNWVWIIVGVMILFIVILLIFLTKRKKIENLKIDENVRRRNSI